MSSYRLPFVLLVFAAIYGRPGPAPVIPGGPRAALIENDGQHPGSVRYTLALDGAHAWLTGDAVWLTYAGRDATAVSGIHLKLSFGRQLDWEPYGSQAGDLCIVLPGEGGAESLRPALWSGARAVLDGGAVLTVTADGIAITGNGRSTADVTVEGGPAEIAGGGSARMVRAGERDLPMRWEVPLNVNGVPAGPHGGTAELAPPGPRPAAGSQIHFSTYIGGENGDEGEAIARDGAGNVYVAGQSLSIFFPTAPGPFTSPRHNVEAFVARLDPQGAGLEYICV
ncbi:MAG TPA: SBBP repeat-containing protein, partial [Anaerolineales bacterium]|nr:SBBP repeat-containing protein [Anaerolineales bacterium]